MIVLLILVLSTFVLLQKKVCTLYKAKWSLFPSFVMIAWVLFICMSLVVDPKSHNLWPLELIALLFINLVVLVILYFIKKLFKS